MDESTDKPRICGDLCHSARRAKCNCWCEGLFHGDKGKAARKAFFEVAGTYPSLEDEAPSAAIEAARKAVS